MSLLMQWMEWAALQVQRRLLDAGEERWFLQYFHSRFYLNRLADEIASYYGQAGRDCIVTVKSLWVDGLPQAVGEGVGGTIKCELSDLLYVTKTSESGVPKGESALLLQGKMSERPGVLPSGASTPEERRLLEDHDWANTIELFSAYEGLPKQSIGKFQLAGRGTGFERFSRYLLIAKWSSEDWREYFAPYLVGWPDTRKGNRLRGNDLVNLPMAAVQMADWKPGSPGHPVRSALYVNLEWNNLVDALYGRKRRILMDGYGQQPYVNQSRSVSSRRFFYWMRGILRPLEQMLARLFWIPRFHAVEPRKQNSSGGDPPYSGKDDDREGGGPYIPIIEVSIDFTKPE